MFQGIFDWIFHRALRLSAKTVVALARKTGQDPKKIVAVNDAVAGIAAHEAVKAAGAAGAKLVDPVAQGRPNAGI